MKDSKDNNFNPKKIDESQARESIPEGETFTIADLNLNQRRLSVPISHLDEDI